MVRCPFLLARIEMAYLRWLDDILKARLKTLGVVEHTFTIKAGDRGVDWKIYDVGGARQQRQAWAPYFEDGWCRILCDWLALDQEILTSVLCPSECHHILGPHLCFRPGSGGGNALYLYQWGPGVNILTISSGSAGKSLGRLTIVVASDGVEQAVSERVHCLVPQQMRSLKGVWLLHDVFMMIRDAAVDLASWQDNNIDQIRGRCTTKTPYDLLWWPAKWLRLGVSM